MYRPLRENSSVFSVSVPDFERRLFDALITTPSGTSYNSFLVKGSEKTALIDTADPSKTQELFKHLRDHNVTKIDYVIANHAEQDHSGSIPDVLAAFPGCKVVTNARCREQLLIHLDLEEKDVQVVKNKETLSLGDRTLQFFLAPWVHWPDNQFAFVVEEKILFTSDFLGAHIATTGMFSSSEEKAVYLAAKRYFAEIMMPFKRNVRQHLETVRGIAPSIIAPAHGPCHDCPEFILDAYDEWSSGITKNEVLIPYVSMHASTRLMVEHLTDALVAEGIVVHPFDLTCSDLGEVAMCLIDCATVILGTGTMLNGPHPLAVYGCYVINALRPPTKFAGMLGSQGWGSKTLQMVKESFPLLKVEWVGDVFVKGKAREKDLDEISKLAKIIAEKHKECLGK